MDTGFVFLIAIFAGGLIGSAINWIATRLPADLPMSGPPLRAWDDQPSGWAFVPFVGALDRETRRVDWPKLATDAAAAVIVAIALVVKGLTFDGWRALVFASVLLLILRIDWQNHLIYFATIIPGLALALGFSAAASWTQFLSAVAAGVAAAFLFLLLFMLAFAIYKQRALGFGDVLLAALIGAMTGLRGVGSALMLGIILAAVGGVLLVAIRVRKRTDFIPYGAYLSLGAIVVILLGQY
ncbi:MAG: peptidase A24 [Chloroflexi bacterium]|nr:MAG: peptidase A24 [Chloroflexota bacterium]